jgi:small GTP-binding protein
MHKVRSATLKIPKYCRVKELAKICDVPVKKVMKSLVTRRFKKYFIAQEKYVFLTKNSIILPFELSSQFVETTLNYQGNKNTKLKNISIEEDSFDPINIMNELLDKEDRKNKQIDSSSDTKSNYKRPKSKKGTKSIFERGTKLPPTVVVLGDRDHGKTSLVNALTGRRVREKGGITQRVGAARYYFNYFDHIDDDHNNNDGNNESFDASDEHVFNRESSMTLLDTPGHQHFVDMQRESAFNADMALVVIACDEGITSGTANVIQHAFDADIPLSFALTKTDLLPNESTTQVTSIENYLKQSFPNSPLVRLRNLNDKSNPYRALDCGKMLFKWAQESEMYVRSYGYASCFVLDSFADRSRGLLLRVLVLEGTLKIDDAFVSGTMYGIVRNMYCVFNRTNPIVGSGSNTTDNINSKRATYEVTNAKPGDVVDIMLRGNQGKLRNLSPPRMGEGFFALPLENSKKIVEYRMMESTFHLYKNPDVIETNCDGSNHADSDENIVGSSSSEYEEIEVSVDTYVDSVGDLKVDDATANVGMENQFPIIVKTDTSSGLSSVNNIINTTTLDVVTGGIGRVTQHDVDVAALYETIIISYNLPVPKNIYEYADGKGVYIAQGDVLPELLDRIFQYFRLDVSDNTKKAMGEED